MNSRVKELVYLALLTALGTVLMLYEFPLVPAAPHLKINFSFVPILVVAMLYSNNKAILVTIVINTLHFIFVGDHSGLPIGVIANMLALITYLLIFVFWQKRKKILLGCVLATLAVTLVMFFANYFFITPFYFKLLNIPLGDNFFMYCVMTVGLFNLISWSIISVVNFTINSWLTNFTKKVK